MRANLQVHAYFNVILVEQLQNTICNREDALLAAAEEIRVAKVEKKHSRVKKSSKSKTAVGSKVSMPIVNTSCWTPYKKYMMMTVSS